MNEEKKKLKHVGYLTYKCESCGQMFLGKNAASRHQYAPTPELPPAEPPRTKTRVRISLISGGGVPVEENETAKIQIGTMQHALGGYQDGCTCEPCEMLRKHLGSRPPAEPPRQCIHNRWTDQCVQCAGSRPSAPAPTSMEEIMSNHVPPTLLQRTEKMYSEFDDVLSHAEDVTSGHTLTYKRIPWGHWTMLRAYLVNLREDLLAHLGETSLEVSAPAPSVDSIHCPFCDSGLTLSDKEIDVIAHLSQKLEVSPSKVWHLALATYQLKVLGVPEVGDKAAPAPSGEPQKCQRHLVTSNAIADKDYLSCDDCGTRLRIRLVDESSPVDIKDAEILERIKDIIGGYAINSVDADWLLRLATEGK